MEPEVIGVAGTLLGAIVGSASSYTLVVLQFKHQQQLEHTNLLRSKLEELHSVAGDVWLLTIQAAILHREGSKGITPQLEESYRLLDKLGLLVVGYAPSLLDHVRKLNQQVAAYHKIVYAAQSQGTVQSSEVVTDHVSEMEDTCQHIKTTAAVLIQQLR